jgi:hypothetical protein
LAWLWLWLSWFGIGIGFCQPLSIIQHQTSPPSSFYSKMVRVAAVQFACAEAAADNIQKGEALVRRAASQGVNIVLLQELFLNYYFCQEVRTREFNKLLRPHQVPVTMILLYVLLHLILARHKVQRLCD